ncbi:hypothetical protein F5146DRAFT_1218310 [Armillaria mellea]|nr:hypothetical protein F5146DRAFT_1218310 [Armillaria mellea]
MLRPRSMSSSLFKALLKHPDFSDAICELRAVESSVGMRDVFIRTIQDEHVPQAAREGTCRRLGHVTVDRAKSDSYTQTLPDSVRSKGLGDVKVIVERDKKKYWNMNMNYRNAESVWRRNIFVLVDVSEKETDQSPYYTSMLQYRTLSGAN